MTTETIPIERMHKAALERADTLRPQVAYACEHMGRPVTTAGVRRWLAAYGIATERSYASKLVNDWRRQHGMANTGDQVVLTPERLAELDAIAARVEVTPESAPVDSAQVPLDASPSNRYGVDPDDVRAEMIKRGALFDLAPETVAAPVEPVEVTEEAPARPAREPLTGAARVGAGVLLALVAVLLAGVIVAPIALSSQDIIDWARSPIGLGLGGVWPVVTFLALDAAAAVCVCLVVYCAQRGESAGVFAWMVWAFAGMSAFANYQHGSAPGAPDDAVWFFPAMSLAGPFLLEMIVRRVRKWVQEKSGQRARHSVSFGFARWVPGVGALRETYGAWRLARLDGINDARKAIEAYRALCPDGSVRVLKALRKR